jgi:hypothetical protein
MSPSPSLGPPWLSPSASPAFGPCGMLPVDIDGGEADGAGAGCGAAEVMGGTEGVAGGAGGARTVKAVVAFTAGCETRATNRRWCPATTSVNVNRVAPRRVSLPSRTYLNARGPVAAAPVTDTCTATVWSSCARGPGDRIRRCATGGGTVAVVAELCVVTAGVTVAAAAREVEWLEPQPPIPRVSIPSAPAAIRSRRREAFTTSSFDEWS